MSKVPYVERPLGWQGAGVGLTGECAYVWALFLANEADMADDTFEYSKWKSMADDLAPKHGKPVPAAVYYADLEEAIEKYSVRGADYYIDCSDPPDMDKNGSLGDRQPEWAIVMSGEYVYPGSDPQE